MSQKPRVRPMPNDTPEALQRRARIALMNAEVATQSVEDGVDLNLMNRWDDEPASAGRRSTVQSRYTGDQVAADRWGFNSFGAFMKLVRLAAGDEDGAQGGESIKARERIMAASLTTYGGEGVGQDGGFSIPPGFRDAIAKKVEADDSLMNLCDVLPTSSNSISLPKDEATPWGGSGITAAWSGEAKVIGQSKPLIEETRHKLGKLSVLVPATNELLEDSPAMESYISGKAGDAISQGMNAAIFSGSGAGMPLGLINSGALVTVSKESSQVADTIHGLNIIKMWSRMPPRWRKDAVWLVNPDAVPALMQTGLQVKSADGVTAVGGNLLFVPGNVSGKPYDALMGRPILYLQDCSALGDLGDISFVNLRQYVLLMRDGGVRADASIHLYFDQDVTAFRFVLRVSGAPWWSAPIIDKNGSTTRSAFIALEAR